MGFIRDNILKFVIIFVVIIVSIVIFSFIFSNKTVVNSYSSMEEKMRDAAVSYTKSNKDLLPKNEDEVKDIKLDTLVNNKKIKELKALEDENVMCTGYVSIFVKDNKYVYRPYLKCGKYYETQTISNYIRQNVNVVNQEDGLYTYGDKLVYRGEDPNNYISLSNRLYRIIEVTEDNDLKLISTVSYDNNILWDDRYNSEKNNYYGINDFSKSRLKDSLEDIYTSEFFTDSDREKIISHDLCVGKRALNDYSIDGLSECSTIYNNLHVSMIQVNEYMRASISEKCTSSNSPECVNYNYFSNINSSLRTINAVSDNTYQVYYVSDGVASTTRAYNSFRVYPVIYLDKNVLYKSGNGSFDTPYTVR